MTRTKHETHTIQTWPGGASFEYRGDPDGPANQKSLRAGYYQARVPCRAPNCGWGGFIPNPNHVTPCQSCASTGYVDNPRKNPWRKGTADEWRTIRTAIRAELYARNYVLCCVSSLVDDLIKAAGSGELTGDLAEGFGDDEIRNIYRDTSDWTVEQCRDYINEHGDI